MQGGTVQFFTVCAKICPDSCKQGLSLFFLLDPWTSIFDPWSYFSRKPSEAVCQKGPKGIQQNFCFLVNVTNLKDPFHVRVNDLGTWRHNGVVTTYLSVNQSANKEGEICQHPKNFKPSKEDIEDRNMFVMRRTYHANGTATDYKRVIVEIEGKNTVL